MNSTPNKVVKPAPLSGWGLRLLPWLFLVLSLIGTAFAWYQQEQIVQSNNQTQLEREADRIRFVFSSRIEDYEDVLRGARGLLTVNPTTSRAEWQQYVMPLAINDRYPGLRGLGFVPFVKASELTNFETSTKTEYGSSYSVKPTGARPDYFPVRYIEPLNAELGFDFGSVPTSRQAAEQARDTGQAALSTKIALPGETIEQASFYVFLPVYRQNLPITSVPERQAALLGWVYAPFEVERLLSVTVDNNAPLVKLEVFDGTTTANDKLLYTSPNTAIGQSGLVKTNTFAAGGHTWTFRFKPLASANPQDFSAWIVLIGILFSLLFFGFIWSLVRTQAHAKALAKTMTANLRESQERFQTLFEASFEAIVVHANGQIIDVNYAFEVIFGYNLNEAKNMLFLDLLKSQSGEILRQTANITPEHSFYEALGKRKDGSTFPIEMVRKSLHYQDRPALVTAIRDISEYKQAEKQLLGQNEELSALYDTTLSLLNRLDVNKLLESLVARAGALLGTPHGYLYVVESESNQIVLRVAAGLFSHRIGKKLEPNGGLGWQVWETGSPLSINNYTEWNERQTDLEQAGLRKLAVVPIRAGDEQIGVLGLAYGEDERQFSETEIALLGRFGQLVSLALENARLYGTVQQELEERKRAETELRKSETKNHALLNALPDLMFRVNKAGVYLDYKAEKENEADSQAIIGRRMNEVLPQATSEKLMNFVGQTLQAGMIQVTEYEASEQIYEARAVVSGDDEVLMIVRDITKRKHSEESAQQQNSYLEALHDTTLDLLNRLELTGLLEAIILRAATLLGTPHGLIGLVNEDRSQMTIRFGVGVSKEYVGFPIKHGEGVGGKVWQTGEPLIVDNYSAWQDRLAGATHQTLPPRAMVAVPLKSGSEIIGVLNMVYVDEKKIPHENEAMLLNRFAQLASVALDNARLYSEVQQELAERIKTEEALALARDQALEASRLKSEFVANMSHEIRTPLSSVIGMSELLLETPLNAEQYEFTMITRNSARVLLGLINDILDFSKIEADKLTLETLDFELLPIVEGATELLASNAADKSLALMSFVAPEIERWLRGDPDRLRQILINMIGNAVKFTERGEVMVSATLDKADEKTMWVRFSIKDSGIGLSEVARKRLFQPFTQADGSTTRKYGGTGLGLSISKRLIDMMGGTLGVDSEIGQGSTFWFTVPLERLSETVLTGKVRRDMRGLHVLVVDDNETHGDIIHRYLLSWGMRDVKTTRAEHALEILAQNDPKDKFDVGILDLSMPGMNGFELAKAIRNKLGENTPRLILLTAFDKKSQGEQALQAGFSAYLTKPVKQSLLFDSIINVLNGHAPTYTSTSSTAVLALAAKSVNAPPHTAADQILLAEDNLVNQKLSLLQLAKLGYTAHGVVTGKQVLEALAKQSYSLILMDCQMPVMDGFEATKAIREAEKATSNHLPIVAMTANAMQGDRETCLASGMDDYITKPVVLEQLSKTLQKWLQKEASPIKEVSSVPDVAALPVANLNLKVLEQLRELQMDGAPDLLSELLDIFFSDTPKLIQAIEQSVVQAEPKMLYAAAHTLKSSAANMGATELSNMAKELELIGRNGSIEGVADKLPQVQDEYLAVQRALEAQRQKGVVSA